jgi:hypothetical protein
MAGQRRVERVCAAGCCAAEADATIAIIAIEAPSR